MKGSKRLRPSGAWELRVYAGTDPVTKKERVTTRTFRGGARQADSALRDFVKEVEGGGHGGTNSSLRWLLDKWLVQIERQKHSPTTIREYTRIIDKTIKPALGDLPLRKIKASDLDELYGTLTERGLAAASVRQVHSVLRASLRQAVKWDLIPFNPAVNASPPRAEKRDPRAPTRAEVQAVIRQAEKDDPELACLIALAAATGARRGELCGLRWGDVNWKAKTLTIHRSVAVMGRGNLVVKDTKTHATRVVALDAFAIAVLKKHRARAEEMSGDLDVALTIDTPLVSYDLVRPIAPDTVSHYVRAAATAAGVDTHLHALRHFSATELIAGGTNVRTVAGRLGHANAATTLRIYAHALPEKDREAAEFMGRALNPKRAVKKALRPAP